MIARIASAAAILLVALLLGSTPAAPQDKDAKDKDANLLVNGSFEEGPEIDEAIGFKSLNKDSKEIKGWTVIRGQIDLVGNYWQHADGKRSIDLHGSPGYGGVKQSFKTVKGKKYRVTFSLAANPDGGVPEKKVGVKAAGKEEKFTFDGTGKTKTDMGWSTQVWDFTATDNETALEIYTLMEEDPNCGPVLDNVSVTAVDD
jgi:choice-of-anchor C domain-containing protein